MYFFICFSYGISRFLKDTEGLLAGLCVDGSLVLDNIETNRLGKRAALSNGDNITLLDRKGGRAVSSNVLMTLFETTVLGNVMKVIPADDNGALHLGGDDNSLKNASTDGDMSGEGALLVDITALNGSSRGLDTETDITGETHGLGGTANNTLAGNKNGILALVGLFVLIALDVVLRCSWRHGVVCRNAKSDEKVSYYACFWTLARNTSTKKGCIRY